MPLDGSGSYAPPAPEFPAIPNTIIYAADFNAIVNDIAAALGQAIFRDGQVAFTADQSMGGFRLRQVGNAVADTDAINLGQMKAIFGFYVGPSATDPLTRTDGSPLQVGDLYFNTTSARLHTFNGAGWTGLSTITIWGTPRKLTIGNTGKSVDGSADVSWSLAEIGASAASHTHATNEVTGLQAQLDSLASSKLDVAATSFGGNAATATKLQTPRLINGTSFDGTADITTAIWGTPRTLTIGNTGKSFDGSADVSWSLDEIGAARFAVIANGTNLNTVVAPGFYRLNLTTGNAPAGVEYGQLIVSRGGDTILQIVTGYYNGEIYWRQGNPPDVGGHGSWSAWYRFFHSGNLGTATESSAGIVELADVAEARALASATVALTPARLADAFKGANQSLSANGYQRLPGGLIIQWGGCNTGTYNLPIAFPTAPLVAQATVISSGAFLTSVEPLTRTQITVKAYNRDSSVRYDVGLYFIALGY